MVQPLVLELRHYETIAAIVEFGTMTEAARHLSATQSALSHRLAEAERRLGTTLFDRGRHRRLTPTRDGLAIHQAATRALDDLSRAERAVLGSPHPSAVTLRVAVGSYDCYHWFPGFLAEVRAAHPDVDLELTVVGDAPGPALAANRVDIVVAPGEPEGDHDLAPLFADELVLVVGPDHHLAGADVVEPAELALETYLTYNAQPTPGFEYDRFIRPGQVYPRLVRVVPQTSAIAELVAAGAGVSILSRWALRPNLDAGRLHAVQCGVRGLDLTWHAATRRGDDLARSMAIELSSSLRVAEEAGGA
ncbi:MAG: LysR family transcriptional regulator [Actinomycetota bacterium]